MAYAIMRTAKLKSMGSIKSCQRHNERERETLNADKTKKHENEIIIGDKNKSYIQYFEEITKNIKIRKNAVYAIECFMSASPEAKLWQNRNLIKAWANDSVKWLQKTFGEENVIKSIIHFDETTPHLHSFIIPIHEGKLNCKKFLGGSRQRLSQLQSEYHQVVEKYDLGRGIEGSQAKHQDVKKYYSALNQELERELPQQKILEGKDKYKKKIDEEYQKVVLQNLKMKYEIKQLNAQLVHVKQKRKKSLKSSLDKIIDEKKKQLTEKKQVEDKQVLNFLNKNPEIKKQISSMIKKDIERDKGVDR